MFQTFTKFIEHALKDDSLVENKSKSQSNQHIKYNVLSIRTYIRYSWCLKSFSPLFCHQNINKLSFWFNMKLEPQLLPMFNFILIIYICVIALTVTLACLRYITCKHKSSDFYPFGSLWSSVTMVCNSFQQCRRCLDRIRKTTLLK